MAWRTFPVLCNQRHYLFRKLFHHPSLWVSNWKVRIRVPWRGSWTTQPFWGTHGRSPRIPVKITKEYRKRESMVLLFFNGFRWCFLWGGTSFLLCPSTQLRWFHPFHPVGEFWFSFYILKHLWVSCLGNFLGSYWAPLRISQMWEKRLRCQTGLWNPHVETWWSATFLCFCSFSWQRYTGNWLVMSAWFSTWLFFYG